MRMHNYTSGPPPQAFWPALVVIALYEYLLFVVYCRLDTNLLSRGKPAVLKVAAAAFGANASWVTIATALQIQVRFRPTCRRGSAAAR